VFDMVVGVSRKARILRWFVLLKQIRSAMYDVLSAWDKNPNRMNVVCLCKSSRNSYSKAHNIHPIRIFIPCRQNIVHSTSDLFKKNKPAQDPSFPGDSNNHISNRSHAGPIRRCPLTISGEESHSS
jgi:hypothetical protein